MMTQPIDRPVREGAQPPVGSTHPSVERLRALRSRLLDLLGLVGAIAYGLPALLYPFGLDQSLFAYIGSGWLHGAWPYLHSFDHKPPGIYLVYALATLVGGSWQGAIRLLELVALVFCGWMIAHAVRGERQRRDGELGAVLLLLSGFYYTCFDFWEGGQVEFWEGLFLVAAFFVAIRGHPTRRRTALAGALAACAILFKYPAILVAVGIGALCAWRGAKSRDSSPSLGAAVRHTASTFLLFGLSASGVIVLLLVPLAIRGGLWEFWDATVLFNLRFADQIGRAAPATTFFTRVALPYVIALAVFLGLGVAAGFVRGGGNKANRWTEDLWPDVWSLLLLALAYAGVALQRKFWFYHYGVFVPFAVMVMVFGLGRFFSWHARRIFLVAVITLAIGFVAAPEWPANERRAIRMTYREHVVRSWRYLRGTMSRDQFLGVFVHYYGFDYLGSEHLGRIVRSHAKPGDTLWVVGFNPIVYWVSGLRCTSRFFATHVLADAQGTYRNGAWRKEHQEAIRSSPPTLLVVQDQHVSQWLSYGYRAVGEFGGWVVLRRVDAG